LPEFPAQPSVEIARRLELRGVDSWSWIALLVPLEDSQNALDGLRADLSALLQKPTRTINLKDSAFEQLRADLHEPADDIVILLGSDLAPETWSSLDLMRSALERSGPAILWISADALANLSELAPNVRSFIGASIFAMAPEGGIMTEQDRLNRLKALAEHYGQSNEEIVRKAQSKELRLDPHFVEWLVLLGRGDLV
jgi:hypothetical protein